MDAETTVKVIKARMWDAGHSFAEIDILNIEQVGLILSYWKEKSRADERLNKRQKGLQAHDN